MNYLCRFKDLECDVVFNALHGGSGEDGTLQACLDFLGIPYTGSGALACGLAMNKILSKHLVSMDGVPLAKGFFISKTSLDRMDVEKKIQKEIGFPAVFKPNNQGSSVGVSVVRGPDQLGNAISKAVALDDSFIVEEYIDGSEITVSILGDTVLPVLEIRPKQGFYDYSNKYTSGASEYLVPAPLDPKIAEAIQSSALQAYRSLGCRVYARVDFRLSKENRHYYLEVNTLPGMTSNSLVPKAARAAGIEFPELLEKIIRLSIQDK
jgi:D-alanine-D-alanine ligase